MILAAPFIADGTEVLLVSPFLADATDPATSGLIQYGALGIMAVMLLMAVRELWNRQKSAFDKEVQRGDRLEAELLALNKLISSELSGNLVRATEALRQTTDQIRRGER